MHLLFVYGSLKEGFPNFHVNRGRRRPGSFVTAQPHELWLLGGQLPALFAAAGDGAPSGSRESGVVGDGVESETSHPARG